MCLLLGVSGPGGCPLWGGLVLGGCVSAPRGVCSGGLWSLGGVVSQHALRQTRPVNRIADACRTLPWPNFVAAGNEQESMPVGSVPPTLYRTGEVSLREGGVFRETPVKILLCPKLHLQAIIMNEQECTPVGCILPTSVAVLGGVCLGGGVCTGVCVSTPGGVHPP